MYAVIDRKLGHMVQQIIIDKFKELMVDKNAFQLLYSPGLKAGEQSAQGDQVG